MPNPELLRIVDGIARDKNIEREQVYTDVEQAIASALRRKRCRFSRLLLPGFSRRSTI